MGQTPIYRWPYPEGSDAPNGPIQMQALAGAIEDTVNGAGVTAVRVAWALNNTTTTGNSGERILCPVTLPVKADRLYRVDAQWYGIPVTAPAILNCAIAWVIGSAPVVAGRTFIYDNRWSTATPWGMPVPSDSPPVSFPQDATVTVWIVTYAFSSSGGISYSIAPSADGSTRPDYLAIYDIGPNQ